MHIEYENKISDKSILIHTEPAVLKQCIENPSTKNILIKGDNLNVMKTLLDQFNLRGKINLVYIDPPFSTNTIFRHNHKRTATISSSDSDDVAYADILQGGEFLEFLRQRLIFIRELMSERASIYLHIDYKIGHYVKLIMDEIFGIEMFRNDITRIKCNPKNFSRKGFGNVKDLILFYSKENAVWNEPYMQREEEEICRLFPKIDQEGRRYATTPLHAPGETKNGDTGQTWKGLTPPTGRHWRYAPKVLDELDKQGLIEWSNTGNPRKIIYADEVGARGKRMQDIWEFKDPQYPAYPTEKNSDLLKFIISTSSNEGQTVLDCFCGSGTTLLAAHALNRRWIGVDISDIAIETTRKKFLPCEEGLFEKGVPYNYYEQVNVEIFNHAG